MLASDLNNPDFVNPVNPDDLMHVEFYWKNPVDYKYFKQTGRDRLLQERVPYVKIMRPGDDKSIMDIPVREDHKARWPRQWLYFQMQEGLVDIGKNIPGWNIDSWDELNDDQRKNLKYLNFHVVEQIAGASDAQVQGLGMGGLALREKARHSLKARMDAGIKEEINRKDVEIAE